MQMSDIEIVSKYNRVDSKKEQVKILAELNACNLETITEILRRNGADMSELEKKPRGRKKKQPEVVIEPEKYTTANILDDNAPIGIIGGDGITDLTETQEETPKTYKSARELKNIPESQLTHEDQKRLERIRQIPDVVKELVENEMCNITTQIMELEKKHDTLVDYLNGELSCKN